MGRFNEGAHRDSKRLLSTPSDFLSALPEADELYDAIWREKPADLETWLYEKRFLGLRIRLSEIQFEALEAMDDIDPSTNKYDEFAIQWGKGSGKDFICAIAGLRQVYKLLCLRNPYDYYGMAERTGIQLVNVAYTKDQAKFVFFKQLCGLIRSSAWFSKRMPKITRDRVLFDFEIEFVSAAADGDSVEGQNMFFALMDEAAAFRDAKVIKAVARAEGVKPEKAADAIFNVLRTSTRSRFPEVGKVVMISYPRYRDDFIQTKTAECKESKRGWASGPYASWEVNPRLSREQFEEDFKKSPENAAAMYECRPPYAEDPYVKFPDRFIRCLENTKRQYPDLESPIDDSGAYDSHFLGMPGRYYAIHVDLALRKDRCALALARQGEPVSREKCPCNKWNFPGVDSCVQCGRPRERWIKNDYPTMVVTLLKSFDPQENRSGEREVVFSDVREEIVWLRNRGHYIWALSFDGWQSVDSIQTLGRIFGTRKVRGRYDKPGTEKEEEIVQTLSVDRTTEAHDTLREFIYDNRFFIAHPPGVKKLEDWDTSMDPVAIAFREWRQLRLINGKKIDHPLGGSKDFVDALAGAAYWIAKMPLLRDYRAVLQGWQESGDGSGSSRKTILR